MTRDIEQGRKDMGIDPGPDGRSTRLANHEAGELDTAGRSLSEALRISFVILKVIMIVLVLAFMASGFKTVGPDEKALVLRFGEIRGVGGEKVLGPGLHWIEPYPIDEMVKIPVERKVNLAINSFWHHTTKDDVLGEGVKNKRPPPEKLDPVRDGYCLSSSAPESEEDVGLGEVSYGLFPQVRVIPESNGVTIQLGGVLRQIGRGGLGVDAEGSDYNIVHSKWQITYQIADAEQFFKNVYIGDVKPGQVYFDVMTKSLTPLLQGLFENAVVTAMVHYTIDEVLFEQVGRVAEHAKRLLQQKLNEMDSGIRITQVQLIQTSWPEQVDEAFSASIKASQESERAISEARTYAENALNEAAGPVAESLYAALQDKDTTEQQREFFWSQLAGRAQEKIAESLAHKTKVVESAKADADYLQQLLPEYRKRPELVTQRIYRDTIEEVLNNVDEKFIIQPSAGARGNEVRILLNRDPSLKPVSRPK